MKISSQKNKANLVRKQNLYLVYKYDCIWRIKLLTCMEKSSLSELFLNRLPGLII